MITSGIRFASSFWDCCVIRPIRKCERRFDLSCFILGVYFGALLLRIKLRTNLFCFFVKNFHVGLSNNELRRVAIIGCFGMQMFLFSNMEKVKYFVVPN